MTAGGAPAQDPGVSGALRESGAGLRWRRVFPGEERQLGLLRRWLELLLPECPARSDVACVATELGTNAVRHTASGRDGWFAVEITWHRQAVRVAVADGGAPGAPQVLEDPAAEHGRGLLVVRGLSIRTGVCGDHRGRLVWADVPWDDAGVAGSASVRDGHESAIGDGQAGLASCFAGVPAWFGRATLRWWALAGGQLVTASSAQELACLLDRMVLCPLRPGVPVLGGTARADTRTSRAGGQPQRPDAPALRFPPGCARVAGGGRDGIGAGENGGPRTPVRERRPTTRARQTVMAVGQGRPTAAVS
jgi:serine/threonine-protein kinase RsbW